MEMNYIAGLLNDAPKSVQTAFFVIVAVLFLIVVVMEVVKYFDRKKWIRSKGRVLSIGYYEKKGNTIVSTYGRVTVGYEHGSEERVFVADGRTGSAGFQAAVDRLTRKGITQDAMIDIKINPKDPDEVWVEGI